MASKIVSSLLSCRFLACGIASGLLLPGAAGAAPVPQRVHLTGDVPTAAVRAARNLGRLPAASVVSSAMILPLRNQTELDALLSRLQDPADPQYGHYLTPDEFTARFGPTAAQYAAAARYAKSQGLTVIGTHANRLLLDVSGPASRMEAAFGVHLNAYKGAGGRVFHASDAVPSVPRALAGIVSGVAGLSNAALRRPYNLRLSDSALHPDIQGRKTTGTGPGGGLAPHDIKTAYGLSSTTLTGSGQTLALFELDGYTASDITEYESYFGLPSVPLQNVLLDGVTGAAGSGAEEVTLDIELQVALAPGVSKVLVYETGGTDSQVLDGYSRIAEDDQAKQISTSWGLDEQETDSSLIQSENTIFQQMAAQGQTIFAASGDSGAYDSGTRSDGLRVDDPASQPYVCGVGGTTLATNTAGTYISETTWNSGSVQNGAGGGGVSSVWPIPSWQKAAVAASGQGSATQRNVPDVSLDADPNTGYAIYEGGRWDVYGGTSCGGPLWSGFTALVNQQRTANGLAPLGQASPALYPTLAGARYKTDFHDIANGSTNLYYPAVTGYDDATGLGTPSGTNLLADLEGSPAATPPTAATTHVLWDNTNGQMSLWNYSTSAGTYTQNTYGPYAGWTATALADGGTDGLTRVLWDNANGTASIWSLNNSTGSYTQYSFGPFSGWTAKTLSVATNNVTHVLWDNTNGQMSLWNYSTSAGTYTQNTYGPYAGWTATALADGGTDGLTRVLWDNANGTASIWSLNNSTGSYTQYPFGPYSGWTAAALSVGPDNTTHVLWGSSNGQASVWNYSTANGTFTQNTYGPYAGWTAVGIADGSDGKLRVLWDNTSGAASVWSLNNVTGVYGQFSFGPYAGWTAEALSSQ